jgi:acyl-coenzyme A synthetase/AMP-(fatty) acid ligase
VTSLLDALAAVAARDPRAPAIGDAAGTRSLAEVLDDAARLADALRRDGVAAGDVVSVVAEAPLDGVVRALAARRAGAVPCLQGRDLDVAPCAAWRWEPGRAPERTRSAAAGAGVPAGAAWLRPTGGTTGTSRLVAFTDAQCEAVARRAGTAPRLAPGDVLLATVPPWTGYGWNSATFGPLLAGARVLHVAATNPRALLSAAGTEPAWRATTAPVVRALARVGVARARTEGWRVLVAGATYPAEEAAALREGRGVLVFDRYGTTEAGLVGQAEEPLGPLVAPEGVTVRGVGEPARLEVRADPATMALGYVVGPGAPPAPPFRGVFATADLVAFQGRGFRVLGRSDRVVKRAGKMVDLGSVERRIAALPGVSRARVRAVPGALDLDLVAFVVASGRGPCEAGAVLEGAGRVLAPWERPTRVEVLEREPSAGGEKWAEAPGA